MNILQYINQAESLCKGARISFLLSSSFIITRVTYTHKGERKAIECASPDNDPDAVEMACMTCLRKMAKDCPPPEDEFLVKNGAEPPPAVGTLPKK